MSNPTPNFFTKLCKFCNKVTRDPTFPTTVVFTLSYLIAGALIAETSALDGGIECNSYPTQSERSACLKFNGVALILALAIPVIISLVVYKIAKDKAEKCELERLK